jgi:hypothetical protein
MTPNPPQDAQAGLSKGFIRSLQVFYRTLHGFYKASPFPSIPQTFGFYAKKRISLVK